MPAIRINGTGGGLTDYASKAAVNRTPKYGGLYGLSARVITIAGVLYQWTGTAIQAISVGATDAAPTAPPSAPTISAASGIGQNVLTLSALGGGNTRTLTRTANSITTALAVGAATSYTDAGLTGGVLAAYAVYDTNVTGDSPTATASATPSTPAVVVPSQQTGLAVSSVASGTATWAWTVVSTNGAYTSQTITIPGATGSPITLGAAVSTYTATGLTDGTAYSATLTATNANGTSSPTAAVVATPVSAAATLSSVSSRATAANGVSGGTVMQDTSRVRVEMVVATTAPQVEFANWYANSGDQTPTNDYYVSAALEIIGAASSPTFYPLTFAGQASVKIVAGTSVKSDALTGVTLIRGEQVYIREHVSVPTLTQKWPLALQMFKERDEGTWAAVQTLTVDATGAASGATSIGLAAAPTVTVPAGRVLLFGSVLVQVSSALAAGNAGPLLVLATSAAVAASSTASDFNPSAGSAVTRIAAGSGAQGASFTRISGQVATAAAPVIILGDSIFAGQNDGIIIGGGTSTSIPTEFGWPRRALGSGTPQVNAARSSERAMHVSNVTALRFRLPWIESGAKVIVDYGTNDLANAITLSALQTSIGLLADMVHARGATIILTTLVPRTDATGVTPITNFEAGGASPRGLYNAWVRAGAGGKSDGFIEMADPVETGRDTGVWLTGYTGDGVHPFRIGHAAIEAAMTSANRTLIGAPASQPLPVDGLIARYLLDEASGTALTDTGIYGGNDGALGNATRRTGNGLTTLAASTTSLPAGVTAGLTGRQGLGVVLAFKVPVTLPSPDIVLFSAAGLTISLKGTSGGSAAGKINVSLTAGGSAATAISGVLAAGDHMTEVSYDGQNITVDIDGVPVAGAVKTGVTAISGAVTLGGATDIHAVLIYGQQRYQPTRATTYAALKTILNARAGVALP